ncbi:hypothetical protein Trichorick_01529 (plasmid) [Candidatus Trichorickettsia mobilis]|nr:hypothetical protein Trichorick_01529 [Candidatus Trichorickettsia mobilis]
MELKNQRILDFLDRIVYTTGISEIRQDTSYNIKKTKIFKGVKFFVFLAPFFIILINF